MVNRPDGNDVGEVVAPASLPPETPWYRTWKLIAVMCLFVLLLVSGAIAVVFQTNRTDQTPAVASSEKEAIVTWWAGARDDFSKLQDALDQARRGLRQADGAELQTGCQRLHDTAEVSLEAKMPTPDPELTAEVRSMIEDFHAASHMCLSAAAGSINSYSGEFQSYLEQAQMQMQAAQNKVGTLTQE